MFKYLYYGLLAAGLVFLLPAVAVHSNPTNLLVEYHQEFDAVNDRDLSDRVEWDTAAGELRLELQTATNQHAPQLLPGPDGGMLALWLDDRTGQNAVFARRFNADGQRLWSEDRFLVEAGEFEAALLPGGGFAVAFTAAPVNNPDIFAAVFDDLGQPAWSLPVRVNTDQGTRMQANPTLAAGPDGSLYVAWTDYRTAGPRSQIFAQRLSAGGQHLWSVDKKISPDSLEYGDWHMAPQAAVDTTGSLVVVWQVQFGYTVPESEDYEFSAARAQRMSSDGSRLWGSQNGVEIVPKTYLEHWFSPDVVALPAGGSLAVFWGYDAANEGMFARRISDAGSPVWPADRLLSSGDTSPDLRETRQKIEIAVDGAGGLGVLWRAGDPLYTQRFDLEASPLWDAPVMVAPGGFYWRGFSIAALSDGSAALAWDAPLVDDEQYEVLLQRFSPDGGLLWGAGGMNVLAADRFFAPQGETTSLTVDTTDEPVATAQLTFGVTLNGGRVAFALSNNGGQSWVQVQPGQSVTFPQVGSDLRWRAALYANEDASRSPQVSWLHIAYEGNLQPPPDGAPFVHYLPMMQK